MSMPTDPAPPPPPGPSRSYRPAARLATMEIAVLAGVPAYWWGALVGSGWYASPAEIVIAGGLGGAWWLLIAGRLAAPLARRWRPPQPPTERGGSDDAPVPVDV